MATQSNLLLPGWVPRSWGHVLLTCAVFALPALVGGLELLYFITPLPVTYYLVQHGFDSGARIVAQAALAAGLLALLADRLPVLVGTFTLLPAGVLLAWSYLRNDAPAMAALKAVAGLLVTWGILGAVLNAAHGVNLYDSMLDSIEQGIDAVFATYRETAGLPEDTLGQFEAAFQSLKRIVPRVFPAMIVTTGIMTVCGNMILANWLRGRARAGATAWHRFREWRLPHQLAWAVVLGGAGVLLPNPTAQVAGLNILLVAGIVYLFQGTAVLASLMDRWAMPRPIRFFVYFMLGFQTYGLVLLAVLGLADTWADFRTPRKEPDESN